LKDLMKKYLNHIWTIPQVADSTERDKTRIPGNSKYSTYWRHTRKDRPFDLYKNCQQTD